MINFRQIFLFGILIIGKNSVAFDSKDSTDDILDWPALESEELVGDLALPKASSIVPAKLPCESILKAPDTKIIGSSSACSLDDAVVAPLLVDKKVKQELRKKLILNDHCLVCNKDLSETNLYRVVSHYGLANLEKSASNLKKKYKQHVALLNVLQRDDFYAPLLAQFKNKREQGLTARLVSSVSRTPKQDFLAELVDAGSKKCLLCPYTFSCLSMHAICAHYGMQSFVLQRDRVKQSLKPHIECLQKLKDSGKYPDIFKKQSEYVLVRRESFDEKADESRPAKRPCTNSEADATT